MNVSGNKVNRKDKNIDILNVKLDKDKIIELLKRNGFCKAYHMNKKNWITIYLDNSISDEEIMDYIEESHSYTVSKKI